MNGKFFLTKRADGRKYKGNWKNGKQHGEGEFLVANSDVWKKGVWEDGKRIRWINEAAATRDA